MKDKHQAVRRADREIENLRKAVKTGGDIEELVVDLRAAKAHKSSLVAQLRDLESIGSDSLGEIDPEEVVDAIRELKQTLEFATPIERKELLKEHVTEIRVPKNGSALLEANPEGLLRCIDLVTPRGVHKKVPKVKARPESICKLDLARIDLRRKAFK